MCIMNLEKNSSSQKIIKQYKFKELLIIIFFLFLHFIIIILI